MADAEDAEDGERHRGLRDSYAVDCPKCEIAVVAKVVAWYAHHYDPPNEPDEPDENFYSRRRALLLRCEVCRQPFLASLEGDRIGNNFTAWSEPRIQFPAVRDQLDAAVPTTIADSFRQACGCLKARLWTPASIMCRRSIDGMCTHQGALGRNLFEKLRYLKESGVIDGRLFTWADALREAGNGAAHDVDINVSKDDATDQVDFTRAVLEYVYTFTVAFQRFEERRNQLGALRGRPAPTTANVPTPPTPSSGDP